MSTNISAENRNSDCLISLDFQPQIVSNLPKTVVTTWAVITAINALAAPATFYINFLVIWTVCENERLRSTSYNVMIAVLSLTDLLLGLVVQPLFLSLMVCLMLECSSSCQLTVAYMVAAMLCCGWSAVSLTIITVERYLAIEHPLYYASTVTTKKILMATAVNWFLMASTLLLVRLQTNGSYKTRQIPVAVNTSICVVIIIFCISKVHRTTRRHMKAIADQEASVQQEVTENTQTTLKEFRRYFTLAIVLFVSVVLYCPALIVKVIGLIKGKEWTDDFKYISQFIWLTCIHFQSLINPFILSLRLSYVRTSVLKKLFCRKYHAAAPT